MPMSLFKFQTKSLIIFSVINYLQVLGAIIYVITINNDLVNLVMQRGEWRSTIGVRRASRLRNIVLPSIISGQSMRLGILVDALQSLANESTFMVYYRPW